MDRWSHADNLVATWSHLGSSQVSWFMYWRLNSSPSFQELCWLSVSGRKVRTHSSESFPFVVLHSILQAFQNIFCPQQLKDSVEYIFCPFDEHELDPLSLIPTCKSLDPIKLMKWTHMLPQCFLQEKSSNASWTKVFQLSKESSFQQNWCLYAMSTSAHLHART